VAQVEDQSLDFLGGHLVDQFAQVARSAGRVGAFATGVKARQGDPTDPAAGAGGVGHLADRAARPVCGQDDPRPLQ
jgi:hypothetical protein